MKRYAALCLVFLLLLPAGCGEKEPDARPPMVCGARGGDFTLTAAGGESLRYEDGAFSGDMTVLEQVSTEMEGTPEHSLTIPYAESLAFQWDEAGKNGCAVIVYDDWGDGSGEPYWEYSASGDRLESAAVTPQKELTISAEEGGGVRVGFSLHCAALDAHGYVTLSGMAGGSVSVRPDEENDCVSFSGFQPGDIWLSYSGAHADPWMTVTLETGGGTLDFTSVAQGTLLLTEEGREARSIAVDPEGGRT